MNHSLNQAFIAFLQKFNAVLELETRLLYSNEVDFMVIDKEIALFSFFLERMETHRMQPHVQRYHTLNREEFIRTELEYLRQFTVSLQEMLDRVSGLLVVNPKSFKPNYSIGNLVDKLIDHQNENSTRGYSSKHIDIIRGMQEIVWLYGEKIAKDFFSHEELDPPAMNVQKEASAAADSSIPDEISLSVIRLKVDLAMQKYKNHPSRHLQAGITSLLKIKSWLSGDDKSDSIKISDLPQNFDPNDYPDEGLQVFRTDPRNLFFLYQGRQGIKVLCNWFMENSLLRKLVPGASFPLLTVPGMAGLFFDENGESAGEFFLTSRDSGESGLATLSNLIKELDFVQEYLLLAELAAPPKPETLSETDIINSMAELL